MVCSVSFRLDILTLLLFSYFDALSRGVAPPVKVRYEPPGTVSNSTGLSKGKLSTLHCQMESDTVSIDKLRTMWINVGCKETTLSEILRYQVYNH